jgi:DNA-3-methyladenine glycosylase I
MQDAGIIRNRLKILATITNAQKFIETQKEFGSFSNYIWGFIGGKPIINLPKTLKDVPATTEISDKLAKDLKREVLSFWVLR